MKTVNQTQLPPDYNTEKWIYFHKKNILTESYKLVQLILPGISARSMS